MVWPVPQAQAPNKQDALPVQVTPQLPQFPGSVATSTHMAPQVVVATGHMARHIPPLQAWPPAQIAPHAPQLLLSVPVPTQTPAQSV